jgi:hypothetical protein
MNVLFVIAVFLLLVGLAVVAGVMRGNWSGVPPTLVVLVLFSAWWWRQRIVLDGDLLEYRTTWKRRTIRLSQVDDLKVIDGYRNKLMELPLFHLNAGMQRVVVNTRMFGPKCHDAVMAQLPERFHSVVEGH